MRLEVNLAAPSVRYTRKSFFLDEATLRRAQKALGTETAAEAVRLSLERAVEMERFWRFMAKSGGSLKPGSLDRP